MTRHATGGMVASIDHLASEAGVACLRSGGSAADAAVAASGVLAVTAPHMCGMGGDLFALVSVPGSGRPEALNASGRAGSGADPDRLRAEGSSLMPFSHDLRSAPVPGCVDGWLALHGRHGRLRLSEVLAPAVSYALEGFPASPLLAGTIRNLDGVAGCPDLNSVPMRSGQIVKRPGVASAMRAVIEEGRTGFYGGEFGRGLLSMGGGEYEPSDFEQPLADWVEPLVARAWGHDLWTIPPNSQGYLTLLGSLVAEGLPLPDDPDDPLWAHFLVESAAQPPSTAPLSFTNMLTYDTFSRATRSNEGDRLSTLNVARLCGRCPVPETPCTCAPSTQTEWAYPSSNPTRRDTGVSSSSQPRELVCTIGVSASRSFPAIRLSAGPDDVRPTLLRR